jgi:hypothetical protein
MRGRRMGLLESLAVVWRAVKVWWAYWLDLLLFGIVWALCWITVVLGPPATFGFFHAVRWLMIEKEARWDLYYRAAREHFVASWLWMLANLLVLFGVYANLVFYEDVQTGMGRVLPTVFVGFGLLWAAVQFYALPYYVLLEKKSLRIAWKNGLFTFLAAPLFSLVLALFMGGLGLLHLMIIPVFLAGPGLVVLMASLGVEDRVQKFSIRERDPKS